MKFDQGYIQVYTGNGKGKTTAALGVALRALSRGMKVCIAQFIKKGDSGEFIGLAKFGDLLTHRAYGLGRFIGGRTPASDEVALARKGLEECGEFLRDGDYSLVILDEANGAVKAGLFGIDELLDILKGRHSQTEVIVTGRDAHPKLVEAADLVTEMCEVKHYWKQKVKARKGIEM